ncbi:MAG: hypothetical protein AAFQ13_01505 [Pseudomonadota bacterium]
MARITIEFLVPKPNKNGPPNWYWQPSAALKRAGWEGKALGKNEAAAIDAARTINAQVEEWRKGKDVPKIRTCREDHTFGHLIHRYRDEWLNGKKPNGQPRLKPKTREVYETGLKRLDVWAGKHPVAWITPARIKVLRDATAKPIADGGLGHSAAFNLLRTLRQVLSFAERIELIPRGSNPAADFDLDKPPARRTIWSAEDEAAFIASAFELGMPSMALAAQLALYTAQRESDLLAFTEPQLVELDIFDRTLHARLAGEDGKVWGWSFSQSKTSDEYSARMMEIPIEPRLAQKVREAIRTNRARDRAANPPRLITHVLIDDRTGLPWKQRAFIEAVTTIRDHAAKRTDRPAMRNLVWHDWRRTRVVRLRRQGMPKEMIGAITGHDPKSIDEMLKVYGPIDPTVTAAALASSMAHENTSNATG